MVIYVDTNILPRWGTLAAPHVAALLAVAKAKSYQIALPSLVLEESVSARLRNASTVFDALWAAHNRASRFSNTVTTCAPSAMDVAEEWRQELTQSFVIVPTPPRVALEALWREVHRRSPARRGTGGRDAAIWLTVLQDCEGSVGRSYFVSENTADFADPLDKEKLHPDLAIDCGESVDIVFRSSIEAVVEDLASPLSVSVSAELLWSDPCIDALRRFIDLDVLPRLLVKRAETRTILTGDVYATDVVRIRRFEPRYSKVYDIDGNTYALIGFEAGVDSKVGVFSRRKNRTVETIIPVSIILQGRAWLNLSPGGDAVTGVEVAHLDKIIAETADFDFLLSVGES